MRLATTAIGESGHHEKAGLRVTNRTGFTGPFGTHDAGGLLGDIDCVCGSKLDGGHSVDEIVWARDTLA